MVRMRVLCSKGDTAIEGTPDEIREITEKIERGEFEEFKKGKYMIYDADQKKVIGRYDVGENQNLLLIPIVAAG